MSAFFTSVAARPPAVTAIRRTRRCGGILLATLGFATLAGADTMVSSFTDAALRSALAAGGTVTFTNSGSITLAAPIAITTNTTLNGGGFTVKISGGGSASLFRVVSNLTLVNLTLSDGRATNGGGVFVEPGGVVLATNCVFAAHRAAGTNGATGAAGANSSGIGGDGANSGAGRSSLGGAIFNQGRLTLLQCQFLTNSATGGNGAAGGDGGSGDFAGGNGGGGGSGGGAWGGAVASAGPLVVSNCAFTANTVLGGKGGAGGAAGGGPFPGLHGSGGGGGAAGGAAVYAASNAVVVNCTFFANSGRGGDSAAGGEQPNGAGTTGAAGGDTTGGGLQCAGECAVTNCTFAANALVGGNGGDGGGGSVVGGDGGRGGYGSGGSVGNSGTLRLVNCTVVGGSSLGGLGGAAGGGPFPGNPGDNAAARGGNLANLAGLFVLKNSILAFPTSGTNSFAVTNIVTTTNTVVGNCTTNIDLDPITRLPRTNVTCVTNTTVVTTTNVIGATNIVAALNAYGTITDAGNNLSSDTSPAFGSSSRNATDPQLGPLADNGGPTLTFLPLANSPALDAGNDAASPAFDQRGVPRPVGAHSDIGAVESWAAVWPALLSPTVIGSNFTFAFQTESGVGYVTEFKNALSDPVWLPLRTNAGTGGTITNSVAVSGAASRFFRVRVQ